MSNNQQSQESSLLDFSNQDIKKILNELQNLQKQSELSFIEKKIVELVIENIFNSFKERNINKPKTFKRNQNKSNKKQSSIKKGLEAKIGEYIILNLKTGGDCCQIRGILSNVFSDFIIVIKGNFITRVKIKEISTISKKIKTISEGNDQQFEKLHLKEQFYAESFDEELEIRSENSLKKKQEQIQNKKDINVDNNQFKIHKIQKEYTEDKQTKGEV